MVPLQKLARFKLELAEAVKHEEFEQAARLRDRIRDMQRQMTQTSHKKKRQSQVA